MEKHILSLLDILLNGGGDRFDTIDQLKKADQASLIKIARNFLEDADADKRMQGIEGLMVTKPEENVDLVLPLFNDSDSEVRWEALHWTTRTRKFPKNKRIISLVIKILLEDPSPENRVEAAEALGYCRGIPDVISALSWAGDHDFESDDQGYSVSKIAKDALERISGK